MRPSLLSNQILAVARARLDGKVHSEANLRRATSDLYYSLFHAVCEAVVEPFGVETDSEAYKVALRSLYRSVDHGHVERQCKALQDEGKLAPALMMFAGHFRAMKTKREEADYDPLQVFVVSRVKSDLEVTEARLAAFWSAAPSERASFAFLVGVRRGK
jgi:uncharacterized protein (UPF0332 family)